jgi:hypothetical protein
MTMLQFDAAVHPDVAAIKCKGKLEVAGRYAPTAPFLYQGCSYRKC